MLGAGMLRRLHVSPLQFLMLLQLNKGARYGYEILKELKESFKGVWEPKTGTIYPALKRLETRGFVKTEMRDDKEFYSLTEKGVILLNQIGERLGMNLRFWDRYFLFISEWMPKEMKVRFVEKLKTLPDEATWPAIFIEHFFDGMDSSIKMEVLERMKMRMMNGLTALDGMIRVLEDGGAS